MSERACLTCGRSFVPRSRTQRRCPEHQGPPGKGSGWSPNRDSAAQARFRAAVLQRDGDRCVWFEQGRRCSATEGLRAAHIVPLAEGGGYDPANGRTLCAEHDRRSDSRAR